MKNNKIIIAIIFGLFLLVLSVVEYKFVGWQGNGSMRQEKEIGKTVEMPSEKIVEPSATNEEIKKEGIVEKAEKKFITSTYNSCGESLPVLIPGYISAKSESSITITLNQKGFNEEKEIKIVDTTDIIEVRVKNNGEANPEKNISFNDLKVGADVAVKVIENVDKVLVAEQIKYLIFE